MDPGKPIAVVRNTASAIEPFEQVVDALEPTFEMIEIVLHAPTVAGLLQEWATLTNLNQSQWYELSLKKLRPTKLDDNELCVSIRLGLNPNFAQTVSEGEQLRNWRSKHKYESLFNVENLNGEEIPLNQRDDQFVYSANIDWAEGDEMNLKLKFNASSSQYPFRRSVSSRDAIFQLFVVVKSKQFQCEHANVYCQIRLFWPGLADQENRNAEFAHQNQLGATPSAPETRLMSLHANRLLLQQPFHEDVDIDDQFDTIPDRAPLDDYDELELNADHSYLQYELAEPLLGFAQCANPDGQGDGFGAVFIEQHSSFTIQLRPSEGQNLREQLVHTQVVLTKDNGEQFTQQERNSRLIELDYEQSQLTSGVLDIRQLWSNQIDIVWRPHSPDPNEPLVKLAFKIHCLSDDFDNEPFQFKARTTLNNRGTNLGSATLSIFTADPNDDGNEIYKRMKFLQQRKPNHRSINQRPILNDPVQLNQPIETRIQTDQKKKSFFSFSVVFQLALAVLLSILVTGVFFRGSPTINQAELQKANSQWVIHLIEEHFATRFGNISMEVDYDIIDKMLKVKLEAELGKMPKHQPVDYQKIGGLVQQQIENKLKKLPDSLDKNTAEQMIQQKLLQLEQSLNVKFDQSQKSFEAEIQQLKKSQSEAQIDPKLAEELVKQQIANQFSNLAESEIKKQGLEGVVDQKVAENLELIQKKFEGNIQTELDKFQSASINQSQIEQIVTEKLKQFSNLYENEEQEETEICDDCADLFENNSSNSKFEFILAAPTAAGVSSAYPTLTNLDRAVWYELRLKKLDPALLGDKLLVSINLDLSLESNPTNQDLLNQWKSFHPTERLLDIEYVQNPTTEGSKNTVVPNPDQKSGKPDAVTFYWNSQPSAKLKIRFNAVHSQFPFNQHSNIGEPKVTFFLHLKVSSQTSASLLESAYCQVYLFWPNGASSANHKADLLLQSSSSADFAPVSRNTKLEQFQNKKAIQNEFSNDEQFVHKLNALLEPQSEPIDQESRNFLHYVLHNPVETFVNVSAENGDQFKGVFLEQDDRLVIKLLPSRKVIEKLEESLLKTRFELNLANREFTEEELINWPIGSGPLIGLDYSESKLSEQVYDLRQTEVNSIEMLWLPKSQIQAQYLAFGLNSAAGEQFAAQQPFLLKISTIQANQTGNLTQLDSASVGIFSTAQGQAAQQLDAWLKINSEHYSRNEKSTVLNLNDPNISQSKSLFSISLPSFNLASLRIFSFSLPSLPSMPEIPSFSFPEISIGEIFRIIVQCVLLFIAFTFLKNIYLGNVAIQEGRFMFAAVGAIVAIAALLYGTTYL